MLSPGHFCVKYEGSLLDQKGRRGKFREKEILHLPKKYRTY